MVRMSEYVCLPRFLPFSLYRLLSSRCFYSVAWLTDLVEVVASRKVMEIDVRDKSARCIVVDG